MATDRVFFRRHKDQSMGLGIMTEADAPLFTKWINDPEVTRYLHRRMPIQQVEERRYIREKTQTPTDKVFGICLPDGELIGSTGLHDISFVHGTALFGIKIGSKAHRGKGFGLKATILLLDCAFRTWGLNAIELVVAVPNERAWKMYERAGFQLVLRDGGKPVYPKWMRGNDGHYFDCHLMIAEKYYWLTREHLQYTFVEGLLA